MGNSGHQTNDCRPRRGECDPQRPALGEQPQEQAEETGEHGEVPGARPMIRRVLVGAAHHPGVVLRCVLRVAGALRRVADQVQGPEDPVAEEQRPYEEERQKPLSGRAGEQTVRRLRCSQLLRWPLRAARCPPGSRRRRPRRCPSRCRRWRLQPRRACSALPRLRLCSGRSSCPVR
jgi:hypothetical protein